MQKAYAFNEETQLIFLVGKKATQGGTVEGKRWLCQLFFKIPEICR